MFALIDGNSFYCSCERAFDPTLRRKALVVLSNNDGCVIARTHEAKDLGVKMGEPWHLVQKRYPAGQLAWRSSNYGLYGDMSRRMFVVLRDLVPSVEPYSIDEMFLDMTGLDDLHSRSVDIRARVLRAAKIPTCVGIGPTKTIAKLANAVAKKDRAGSGVCDLSDVRVREALYQTMAAGEVWGIGGASAAKLERIGVKSIAQFLEVPGPLVRAQLSVVGERVQRELRGDSCLPLSLLPARRKSLAVTRSFGQRVSEWPQMEQALAAYATRAAEKLRGHQLVASAMQVFVMTNRFSKGEPSYANQVTFALRPTNDTFELVAMAVAAGRRLWRDGFRYQKSGVVLIDLVPREECPPDLFAETDGDRAPRIMTALDAVNRRFGRGTLRQASLVQTPAWSMRRANISPSYTTRVGDMLKVRS